MAALACDTQVLMAAAKCLLCFTEQQLLAAEALLREQLRADADGDEVAGPAALLADSVAWDQLSEHMQQAIRVAQLCNDAVDAGARDDCDAAALMADAKCYCSLSKSDLQSIISRLECIARQT